MYDGDDEYTEWFSGVRSGHYWIRGALMVLFYLVLWFVRFIVLALALFQFGSAIVVGRPNERVKPFARQLGAYMRQLVEFVTWASELRPYPLSPWPGETAEAAPPEEPESKASWAAEEEVEEPFAPEPEPSEAERAREPEPEEAEPDIEPEVAPLEEDAAPPKPAKAKSAKSSPRSSRKKGASKSKGSDAAEESGDDDAPPRPDA